MIQKIEDHSISPTDKFILDTNVLILLFGPNGGNQTKINRYSSFLQKAFHSKSTIYITSGILSEFVNVYFKLDFDKYCISHQGANYKRDFRPSNDFKTTVSDLKVQINSFIKRHTQPLSDQFDAIQWGTILSDLENSDFNDNLICEVARLNGLIVVSDDGDWYQHRSKLHILTANNWLSSQPQ